MHLLTNFLCYREVACIILIEKCPVSKQLRIICLKTQKTITYLIITSFKDMVEQLQHPEDQPKNFTVFLQWVGTF